MRQSKALVFVMFLLLLVPFLFAGEISEEIAETRSALLEGYEEATSLAEMSEEAYLKAAEARENAATHADLFAEAVESEMLREALDHAVLADEASQEAERLEREADGYATRAEAAQDNILALAGQYAELNRNAATQNRMAAEELSSVLAQLPDLPAEEPDPISETAAEPVDEGPEEEVIVDEAELWRLVDLYAIEGGVRYYVTEEELEAYPLFAELDSDGRLTLIYEAEGITVAGDFIVRDEMVGFVPEEFEGIPQDISNEFYNLVDEFDVVLPETYWFEVSMEDDVAVLSADGVIDDMDYQVTLAFAQQ